MTTTNYIQLPPDGVGKKTRHKVVTDLVVTLSANAATLNTTVYGATSGAVGTLVGTYNAIDASINWYIDVISNANFVSGENIWSAAGGTGTRYATVAANGVTANVYQASTSIADAKAPENTMTIDSKGAAFTRFFEGTPQFDAWGHMQVSQMQAVGEYYHYSYDLADRYWTSQVGAGSVQYNPQGSSMWYTTTSTNGDIARRTSAQYHPYKPGVSQLFYTSVSLGDAGRTNVIREWGYFDDYNGFGFRLDGTTFKVFLRSDISGVVTDTEVTQANWNQNTLLSATTSEFLLDPTKVNLYWMDVQGTIGRIRLGVETADGRRIAVHEFRPINSFTASSCRVLTLPVTWAQRNVGLVDVTSGNPTMRVGAGVVFSETSDILYTGQLICITPDDPIEFNDPNTFVPFLSFKAKSTIPGPQVWANTIVANVSYTIVSNGSGSTNFQRLGAASDKINQTFTANANGNIAGIVNTTGRVYQNVPNSAIGIHETFDWATQGNVNLEVGIFVLPSEDYLTDYQWSDTYTSTSNVLWVDVSATSMPQVQLWSNVATFSANIGGPFPYTANNIMTVGSVTSGSVTKELFLRGGDGSALTARTKILKQLTSNATPNTTTTVASGGATGQKWMVVNSNAGIGMGQLVQGTNVPQATFVESIVGSNVYCSQAMTGTVTNVTFTNPGGTGTYLVNNIQTKAGQNGIIGNYAFKAIEAFVAPANSNGRTALGDRIEKSFGLGPNYNAPENAKGVFVFAARPQASPLALTGNASGLNDGNVSLWYTKFYKEIR
jgi:hypothetical protein